MAQQQAVQQKSDLPSNPVAERREQYDAFVQRLTTDMVAAMPLNVPTNALKRARAQFRVAFSADAQGALLECTPDSIARAIVLSALSGLFPGGPKPDVWLIPRRNRHRGNALEANWQISYRGYIRLARRAGWDLEPVLVFEGEQFEVHEGMEPKIVHVRNLETPQTWETLRYGYARVYPIGQRDQAKIVYLNKAAIEKRRKKAQDDSVWREWPLEQSLKTLCNYAGARETFPLDDPGRYALQADTDAEIGTETTISIPSAASAPGGSRTEQLAARLESDREPPNPETGGKRRKRKKKADTGQGDAGPAGGGLFDGGTEEGDTPEHAGPPWLEEKAVQALRDRALQVMDGDAWTETLLDLGATSEDKIPASAEGDLVAAIEEQESEA